MILISMKIQIQSEKMDYWPALADCYTRDISSEHGCFLVRPEPCR